jgi:hypothetical protein
MAKEGLGVKLPIWPTTTKSQELPWFYCVQWHATYRWKALNEDCNFALELTLIEGLHTKLWVSKIAGVLILRISRFQLGSLRTKWHLSAGHVARHREYYKGEVVASLKFGGFPQVWAMVSLVSLCLPLVYPCTKSVPIMHWPTCCLVHTCPCE